MKMTRIMVRISLLLILTAAVVVAGCKATQPETSVADPSEQAVEDGLQELEEIDSLDEETDLGLEEIENIDLK
ncbi:MAG: hypothetical protein AABY40_03055 [Nanoarchaeota archaeon]